MLNQVSIIGHLGADPEVRSFSNGGKVCNLRIATTEKWKDKDGNPQEHTDWHTVAIFSDGLVGVCERYLKKGSKVFVQGKLQTRKYQAQDGSDRYSTEVVLRGFNGTLTMLDGPSGNKPDNSSSGGGWNSSQGSMADELDDDLPPF